MTNTHSHDSLFPFSALPSLTSIACFACMGLCGINTSLQIAMASATLVFCSRRILADPENQTP